MTSSYISLGIAALFPVIASALFCVLEKFTGFGKIKYIWRQIIIGLVFGGLAIIGTEWGIPLSGAMVNARDAAPLCAGLFFGGPAGIIAGVIGGVERWIAVAWGVGSFTRIACSVSTIIAGIYAALLRKYMFDNKRPGWSFALAIGVVMEVFHLTMVYVTNLGNAGRAAEVIKVCTLPMVIANALSVMIAAMIIALISHERLVAKKKEKSITLTIQRGLLSVVLIAFLVTTTFIYIVQTNLAKSNIKETLTVALDDISDIILESRYATNFDTYLDIAAHNRHIGSTGYLVVADFYWDIISAPGNMKGQNLIEIGLLDADTSQLKAYVEYDMGTGEDRYLAMYKRVGAYNIFAIFPYEEAMAARDNSLYLNCFMEILVFAALFAVIYFLIKKVVLNNLIKINKSLAEITAGNLDTRVEVHSNQEFASLSMDINSTVDTLKHYISEAASRIDKELEFARSIQVSALPHLSEDFIKAKEREFSVYGCMNTAKEVGGDFYDVYMTKENELNFVIADVSGKGIPAAMFMMRSQTQLKSLREADYPINDVFTTGNNDLCVGNDAGMFVTAWMGILNTQTGEIKYANAGHNPPLVRRKDGTFEYLQGKVGLVLAGMEDMIYKEQTLKLEHGDIIYLYTDGVTEATSLENELFGEDRLRDALNEVQSDNMQDYCDHVLERVAEFVGEAPQFDDMTMVALRYNGD